MTPDGKIWDRITVFDSPDALVGTTRGFIDFDEWCRELAELVGGEVKTRRGTQNGKGKLICVYGMTRPMGLDLE